MASKKHYSDIDLGGNKIKNAGFEVVTSLPTNNFVGRQVTYQGRSYIWDGSAWKCDAKLFNLIKGTDIASLDGWSQNGWTGQISTYTNELRTYKLVSLTGWRSSSYQLPLYLIGKKLIVSFKAMRISSETTATASKLIGLGNGNSWDTYQDYYTEFFDAEGYGISNDLPDDTWVECTKSFILNDLAKFRIVINGSPSTKKTTWLIKDLFLTEETQENWNISLEDKLDVGGTAVNSEKLDGKDSLDFYGKFESSVLPILNQQRTNLGNPSVFETAVVDAQFTNKIWFFPIANTLFERSTDDITYTTALDVTDLQKVNLFGGAGNTNANISIPKGSCLRITLSSYTYVILNMLYLYYDNRSDACYIKIEKYNQLNDVWSNVIDYQSFGSWPAHTSILHPIIRFQNSPTESSKYYKVRITIKVNPDTTGGTYPNHVLYNLEWWGGFPAGRRTIYSNDGYKNVYFPASVQSNQTINFDTNNIEPTQTETTTKTSTWLWQYLTQSVNFLWLKLKDLFPTTQSTTHNYLPRIDNADKKLVKSNINDDGTTPKYGANTIWHSGNDGSNSGLEADLLDGKHASDFANVIDIYNAHHEGVPTDDFDVLFSYENDVWLCSHSMRNAPFDDEGNNNTSYNSSFENCVVQQFGNKDTATKIQVLYITTGDVTNLSIGGIFYRIQRNKWKRIVTYSDIADLPSQIGNLATSLNSKLDKMSETTVTPSGTTYADRYTFIPTANHTLNINCPTYQNLYVHIGFLNSLDEAVILVNNNGGIGSIDVTFDADYKVAGMVPFFTAGSKWIISIFKGILFFNQIN